MAVRWEQRPSGQLVIEQNADWLVRIFGALCAIPSLYFAWFLGLACVEYGAALLQGAPGAIGDLIVSIPGILITVVMLLAFAVPAWMLLFARTRAVLDPARQTIIATRDFRLVAPTRAYGADAFNLVELALPENERSRAILFHVTLLGPRNARLDLAVLDDREVPQAIELSRRVADLFGYTLRERIGGWQADTTPLTLYIWEPAFWRREARWFKQNFVRVADLLTGRKQLTWQMLNPWPSTKIPPVVLGRVQWAFVGERYKSQAAFNKAVRAFQTGQGQPEEEWNPAAVAVHAPQIIVEYEAPGDRQWTIDRIVVTAHNEQSVTNAELLFNVHNAVVDLLRDTDLVYLQGFELVTDRGPDAMPVYRLRQMR